MEISDKLQCLFAAEMQEQGGTYRIEIPDQELELGQITQGETYRVALLPSGSTGDTDTMDTKAPSEDRASGPPVEAGDTRDVEIDDIGDQGDGIARIERGFVVIVPDTKQGEQVTIEITNVQESVAFGSVVDR